MEAAGIAGEDGYLPRVTHFRSDAGVLAAESFP